MEGKEVGLDLEIGGLFGFILLIVDVWAVISVFGSQASTAAKVFWIVGIILLPLIGFIAWLIFGPKSAQA